MYKINSILLFLLIFCNHGFADSYYFKQCKINENAFLQNTAYYQFDLSRSSDNRLLYDGDLNIALNDKLAFTLTLNYRQDSDPHGDLGKSYIQLKNGIEFIF